MAPVAGLGNHGGPGERGLHAFFRRICNCLVAGCGTPRKPPLSPVGLVCRDGSIEQPDHDTNAPGAVPSDNMAVGSWFGNELWDQPTGVSSALCFRAEFLVCAWVAAPTRYLAAQFVSQA